MYVLQKKNILIFLSEEKLTLICKLLKLMCNIYIYIYVYIYITKVYFLPDDCRIKTA